MSPVRSPFSPWTNVISQSGCRRSINGAQNLASQGFQFGVRSVLERHFANMVPNVEVWIEVPGRQGSVQGRDNYPLQIARDQWEFGLDEVQELLKRDFALQNTDAGDIERHASSFKVQEHTVSPGQAISALVVRHGTRLL